MEDKLKEKDYDPEEKVFFFGYEITNIKNIAFENWRLIVIISLFTLILLLATIPNDNISQLLNGGGKLKSIKTKLGIKTKPGMTGKQYMTNKYENMKTNFANAGDTAKNMASRGLVSAQVGVIRLAGIILSIATTFFFLIVFMPITSIFLVIFLSLALLKPKISYLKSL
jgi:hypothetical protein